MLSYELCKKLKESGFPQGEYEEGKYISSSGTVKQTAIKLMVDTDQAWYIPTLSELIESCGDDLKCLYKSGRTWLASTEVVHGLEWEQGRGKEASGETSIIAVCNLYLSLHPNQK